MRTIVARWYAGRTCVYCNVPIREISGSAVLPALLSPYGELREWSDANGGSEVLDRLRSQMADVCAKQGAQAGTCREWSRA